MSKGTTLPHHSYEEWIQNGYLWKSYRCPVKGCGLLVIQFYWPNDPPYNVDPVTYRAHAAVCCDPERVAAMNRTEDSKAIAKDHKSASAGDK